MEVNVTNVRFDIYSIVTRNNSTTAIPMIDPYDDQYYDYDYEADPGNIPLDQLVPVSIVYGITMILGLLGNSLVIFSVAKFKKMQNVTNMFLLSLATADLLLVMICVPIKCAAFFSYTWKFGKALCKIVHYVQNVSIMCSVMNLTVLSLERYYAVIHPIRAKCVSTVTLAKKTVGIIWIASLFMASPIVIGRIHKPVGDGNTSAYWCKTQWERPVYGQVYGVYMFVVILVIPLCLMGFAYTCICHRVWILHKHRPTVAQQCYQLSECEASTSTRSRTSQSNGKTGALVPTNATKKTHLVLSEYHTRQQVIKMLVAIVVLFVICWGPITVNNLLVAFGLIDDLHQGFLRPLRITFFLLSYVNSCTNPVVYAFMSRHFRRTFKQTLFVLCKKYTVINNRKFRGGHLSADNRSNSFHSVPTTSFRTARTFHTMSDLKDKYVTRIETCDHQTSDCHIKQCVLHETSVTPKVSGNGVSDFQYCKREQL